MKDIPLHDIKPLVEVPDNSMIYVLIIAGIMGVILLLIGVWLWKHFRQPKQKDMRKFYMQKIHEVDLSNAKQAAYEISEYGRHLATSERAMEMLANLDARLEQYKYKKEVSSIDDETRGYYQLFLEVLDAS